VQPEAGGLRVFSRDLTSGRETQVEAKVVLDPSTDNMVEIPGGTLSVRDARAPLLAVNGRDVQIATFYLDRYEVSNAEYRVFLESTGYPPPAHWDEVRPVEDDRLPVVQVGFLDAQAYAEWAGKRLPSFPEWLWAARGSENRIYPWPDPVLGEYRGNVFRPLEPKFSKDGDYYHQNVEPVEAHPEACTASGLFNMLGNVREWTETFVAQPVDGHLEPRSGKRLIAGHDWHAAAKAHDLTTFAFSDIEREFAEYTLGFRCALSKEP
jgi:formylglycine-generating enzyme required for sulfatase activity